MLVIFIGLSIVPLLLVSIFLTRQSNIYLKQQSQELLHQVAVGIGNEIKSFVENHTEDLLLIQKLDGSERLDLDKHRATLDQIMFDRQVYQDISLLSSEGQELIRVSRSKVFFHKDLQSWAGRKEFLSPATRKTLYFSAVRFDDSIQEPLLTISLPLFDLRTGRLSHVIVGHLRFKKIWDLLANMKIPGKSLAYVIDQTNRVVAHPNPTVVLNNTTVDLPDTQGSAIGLSGDEVIISWESLQLGDQRLTVVAEQPVSQALVLLKSHFRLAAIITSITIVIAIFFLVLAIRHFVKPIKALSTATQAISKGDYSQRVEVVSQDEVGILADAFNKMNQELESYNKKMDELVRIRTDQLAQANINLEQSLARVKKLSGLLPICASCKKIRDDKGYWNQIESYLLDHSEAEFSHGVCPECAKKLLSELDQYNLRKK